MVACPTDGSFYHLYDLSICHDGSLHKPAYKVDSSIIYLFYLCCRSQQNTDMENTTLEYIDTSWLFNIWPKTYIKRILRSG